VALLPLLGETDPLTYTPASAGGDEFDNADGFTELEIWNRAGKTLRVIFTEQRNCTYGETGVHVDQIVTMSPGVKTRVRLFQIWRYNNSAGRIELTYPDGELGLALAALYRPAL
jgi:hypothetical protein